MPTVMASRTRLDAELVRRGLARSREQAAELITGGRVAVAGLTAGKPATQVGRDAAITVSGDDGPQYVSRGGHKLAGALDAFGGLTVAGRRCLDAGASTGGFTEVLLRAGAAHVVAVDVGYGQLAWVLRGDPMVTALESCAGPDADFVLLVKPQFEVGKGRVGPGGVVRDPRLRAGAVAGVADATATHGLGVAGITASP